MERQMPNMREDGNVPQLMVDNEEQALRNHNNNDMNINGAAGNMILPPPAMQHHHLQHHQFPNYQVPHFNFQQPPNHNFNPPPIVNGNHIDLINHVQPAHHGNFTSQQVANIMNMLQHRRNMLQHQNIDNAIEMARLIHQLFHVMGEVIGGMEQWGPIMQDLEYILRSMQQWYYRQIAAGVPNVDLRSIDKSVDNALIIVDILRGHNDHVNIVTDQHAPGCEDDFIVGEGDDLIGINLLIGRSTRLKSLALRHMPLVDSFRDALAENNSIQKLMILEDLGEEGYPCLAPFFQNTNTLEELELRLYSIEFEAYNSRNTDSLKNLASLLSQYQTKSLKKIYFVECEMSDNEYTEIARALIKQPQLEELYGGFTELGIIDPFLGHIALGDTMKHWKSPCLKVLDLQAVNINDDGLVALVEGMANCSKLEGLNFRGNNTITELGLRALSSLFQSKKLLLQSVDLSHMNISDVGMAVLAPGLASLESLKCLHLSNNNFGDVGLKALATVFQSESCSLKELHLRGTRVEDSGAIALANGLRGNKSLTKICFDYRRLTNVGWSAFGWLLYDTSSVNNTYHSNHALEEIGTPPQGGYPITIKALLEVNKQKARGLNVPICKILMSHSAIDMTPLLQWKLKLLPFFVTWCERAQPSQFLSTYNMKSRKLSAIYQFVVGEPELVVDAYGEKNSVTTTSISRKRKINQLD